jgi:aminoglycoside phosphotransferase (APT) family kinase protein
VIATEAQIRPLLDHLAGAQVRREDRWEAWRIRPISGGRNNLLYRVTSPQADLAVKFCIRDGRDRAGREFRSLTVLNQAGLSIAPEPVLLDRDTYRQPVAVLTWLPGRISAQPPDSDADWLSLVQHLVTIHSIKPGDVHLRLPKSTLHASSAAEAAQLVHDHAARIPPQHREPRLQRLLAQLPAARFPSWPTPVECLCRLDNSLANYVRRPGAWASVDWEYSGRCDPAFDLANMLTHVALKDAPLWRWSWAIETYAGLVDDERAALRARVYCQILIVWWATRLARYLFEIPRGLDPRLAAWTAGWEEDIRAKYEHYLGLAEIRGKKSL